MGRRVIDETGNRHSHWVVLSRVENYGKGPAQWLCRCDCGTERVIYGTQLRNRHTKSCGCVQTTSSNLINEIGNRYGRLVVLSRVRKEDKRSNAKWLCKCDCGNTTKAVGYSLKIGNVKSCGCLFLEMRRKGYGEASFNKMLSSMKEGAKKRGHKWRLTKDQVKNLTKENCHYCGTPPKQKRTKLRCNGHYLYNGLDRLDNSKGYVVGNVVPCCGRCNKAKTTYSKDDFLDWIGRVYKHSIGD